LAVGDNGLADTQALGDEELIAGRAHDLDGAQFDAFIGLDHVDGRAGLADLHGGGRYDDGAEIDADSGLDRDGLAGPPGGVRVWGVPSLKVLSWKGGAV